MEFQCQGLGPRLLMPDGKSPLRIEILQIPEVTQGRKNPLWMGSPKRLHKLRQGAHLSQNALQRLSDVPHAVISRVEAELNRPKIDTIERLAVGLGISPVYLAFGPEGDQPFRPKTPSYLKSDETPTPQPGTGVFRERYKGAAERLRTSRERLGLSLRDLAAAAQVSYQAVLYTETGQTVPRLDTVEAIAVALDVAPGWLAYGDDE